MPTILLLEDDVERIHRFASTAALLAPPHEVRVWADAFTMMEEVREFVVTASLISLDHDLETLPGSRDPGDGLLIARFLASQPIVRPVIVHSSNAERARMMMGEFELAGWPQERVLPIGVDWIERDWRRAVERLIFDDLRGQSTSA